LNRVLELTLEPVEVLVDEILRLLRHLLQFNFFSASEFFRWGVVLFDDLIPLVFSWGSQLYKVVQCANVKEVRVDLGEMAADTTDDNRQILFLYMFNLGQNPSSYALALNNLDETSLFFSFGAYPLNVVQNKHN